ncbi:alcohol dehydrogenase catalytic domain-containing protein [Cryobacterium algoricola]|uniref:alcohol dehydrogenase catalytic domain-containing protein n=1 Tax=Cryobacterium algoricola TaxID=1259183 RepID=UPI0015808A41|nr:alcohol dehydrogenase catalytic domain-containing protein [Cryobacterium algoricola]
MRLSTSSQSRISIRGRFFLPVPSLRWTADSVFPKTGVRAPERRSASDRSGARELPVRIVVSGVNPTDWKSRRGSVPGESPTLEGVVPGQNGAGSVVLVGAGVAHFAVGDRVWLALAAYQRGAAARPWSVRCFPAPPAADKQDLSGRDELRWLAAAIVSHARRRRRNLRRSTSRQLATTARQSG